MRERRRAVALAAVLAASVAASVAAPGASGADGPLRLVVGVVGPIDQPAVNAEVDNLQHPTLTALAPDTLEPIPGLARAWMPTSDGRGWTYSLDAAATFSDGAPVTARDVVSSLERARADFPGLTATAVDDHTVTIAPITDDDRGALPTLLLNVRPAHAHRADPAVGAGAWTVAARTDTEVTLRAVERPGRPALDEIVFRSHPEAAALLDALARGDVDVAAMLPPAAYSSAREVDGTTVIHANDGDQWIVRLRIDDRDTRLAIARSIDRGALVAEAAHGVGRTSPVPVVARGTQWQLDADEAARLADDLRHDAGGGPPPGVPSTLTLAAPEGETGRAIAAFVADALAGLGIEAVPAAVTAPADLTIVRRDPGDDPLPALAPYTCAAGLWCDDRYDAAYERFEGTDDTATRIAAAHEMVRLLAAEAPEVVLFAPDDVQAFRTDRVSGLLREPSDVRLVVFWPSVEHYRRVVRAQIPGGEEIPDSVFALIAAAVGGATIAALVVAARIRRSRLAVDGDVERAVGGEGLPRERSPA